MIAFLNFAPYRFMGGAEKWAYETAMSLSSNEDVNLISVTEGIANIYAKFVLKRKFESRFKDSYSKDIYENILTYKSFLPFTSQWLNIRTTLHRARLIYLKYELLELIIVIYFGGFNILKKCVAGIHTPFVYSEPITFLDKLHNIVYSSAISKFILRKFNKVHVITKRDYNLFSKDLNITNVAFVPNSMIIDTIKESNIKKEKNNLKVIFVGELIPRKGIDILSTIIENSPKNIYFNVVGDGPLKKEVERISSNNFNCKFHNYLDKKSLYKLYSESDVLILPSRAEGFPLVFIEALAHGLIIVTSEAAAVGLPDNIEQYAQNKDPLQYIKILSDINKAGISDRLKQEIKDLYLTEFSVKENKKRLNKKVFSI